MLYKTTNKDLPLSRVLGLFGALIFAVGFLLMTPVSVYAGEDITIKTCAQCHEDEVAAFKNMVHAAIDSKGLAGNAGSTFSCTACHGDVSKHIEEGEAGTVFAFKKSDSPAAGTKKCLTCHKDSKGKFFAGPHAKGSMGCTDCHSVHSKHQSKSLVKGGGTKSCFKCHEDVFAYFKMNERHRLGEVLDCTSCHDPHKPVLRNRLGGFKDKACFKCHTDKKGPFMYEHGAVRVEGCASCHDVHGSPNRHMLNNQRVADLCYSCHTHRPGWHATLPNVHDQNCAVCHSTIHGSNLSSKFIK